MNDLHTKYRPQTFDEVVGQDEVVRSLKSNLAKRTSRAFIFVGPSGTGKTTLARILAREVGCSRQNLQEVDAATFNGVDDMRTLTENAQYAGLGKNGIRFNVLDEVHLLSKSAWSALLKVVEEPPPHLWWAFCTTEAGKIPATIKNRCVQYALRDVDADAIYKLLQSVNKKEGLGANDDVLYYVAEKAGGSVRAGLTGLSLCAACKDRKSAAKLLRESETSGDAIQLCRGLAKGLSSWSHAMKLVEPIKDVKGESVRMTVVGYFTTMLLSTKSDQQAQRALAVLNAFRNPYPSEANVYPVLLSLGDLLF